MLEMSPALYRSIRDKFMKHMKKYGTLSDKQYYKLHSPKPKVVKLQKVRGHLNCPDFFTFVSNDIKFIGQDISEENDFGLELDNNKQMKVAYEYLKGYVARMGLALSKFNTNNHMGELKTVPLIDFSVDYNEETQLKLMGITDAEVVVIKSLLGNYHDVE